MILSDDILIERILSGDQSAEELLIEKHLQGIFAICFRICQDEDDAHDITQNTCIKILGHIGNFKKQSEFKTWAYRIAYNESLGFLRSRKEYVELETVEPYLGKPDEYDIDERDREKTVQKALDSLSPTDRSIILFSYYDELKIREIAEILDMNENTVKTRLSRAKAFLQPILEPLGKHL